MKSAIAALTIAFCGPAFSDSLTATRVVRPNSIITAEDFAVGDRTVPGALASDTRIIGLEAKITLYPGRPIMPEHVGAPALVERNQPVVVVFRQGSLSIATDARALSRGAVGETVRVMNMASRNTVSGKVQSDGTVLVSNGGLNK